MRTTYLTIKLNLAQDLSEEEVQQMTEELDYSILHRHVDSTEIIEVGDLYD